MCVQQHGDNDYNCGDGEGRRRRGGQCRSSEVTAAIITTNIKNYVELHRNFFTLFCWLYTFYVFIILGVCLLLLFPIRRQQFNHIRPSGLK